MSIRIREALCGGIAGLSLVIMIVLCVIIHFWTVIIAYLSSGIMVAVITMFAPFISETYWFFQVGADNGFDTAYCISIIIFVGLFLLLLLASLATMVVCRD